MWFFKPKSLTHPKVLREDPRKTITLVGKDPLGTGSMGTVWKAKKPEASRLAAKIVSVKQIMATGYARREVLYEAHREVSLHKTCAVGCRFVVQLYETYQWKEEFWFVMERCVPGSMVEVLKHVSLPYNEMCATLYCAAQALKHIHGLGIYHGDVRAANLLLDEAGIVKLCDFGGASREDKRKTETATTGTKEWAAPEVLKVFVVGDLSAGTFTRKADVWSFGILALELVDLSHSFFVDDDDDKTVFGKLKERSFANEILSKSSVEKSYHELVFSCLTYDHKKRPSMVDVFKSKALQEAKVTDTFLPVLKDLAKNFNAWLEKVKSEKDF